MICLRWFWKYIKSRKNDNIGVSPLKSNGKLVSNSKGKAEILIQQFKSVFTIDKSTVSIDFWKITVKLGVIWLAHSLRIRLGISSGPDAFDGFMSWSSLSTPFSLMLSFGMGSSMCLVVCGMAVDLSMVKTDLNCWINISTNKSNELINGTTINTSKKKSRSRSGKLNGHIYFINDTILKGLKPNRSGNT
jgi:hypothetical protein